MRGREDGAEPLARMLADQLFSRVAGAAPVQGNAVRLLRDGAENYPAWLEAIAAARQSVHFENYIFRDDPVGREFADALIAKAREGVPVRMLYDWLGCLGRSGRRYWRPLRAAGVEVRCFNRPRIDAPFGWLSRNHRKTLSVDGRVGFVAGLCVGQMWMGDARRRMPPWRDTGIRIEGPAVADLEQNFARIWAEAGPPVPAAEGASALAGQVPLRIIGSRPNMLGLYRLDQLIAAAARHTLWLTDAYFAGTTAYVRALCDAARDGVDVRLLVPGTSDIPVVKAISRAGYRPLLEAGIRVFEWNGPMLHAKTAVADGRWARIGSSNLNLASWLGNWELDAAIEDAGFARQMEEMFLDDLENATEIVLDLGHLQPAAGGAPSLREGASRRRGSPGRLAAGAVGIGSTVRAAITNHRALGPAEARVMGWAGAALLLLTAACVLLPQLITYPLGALALWVAITLLLRALKLRGGAQRYGGTGTDPP